MLRTPEYCDGMTAMHAMNNANQAENQDGQAALKVKEENKDEELPEGDFNPL